MHSSSPGPPNGEWSSGLPGVRWPLPRLRQLRIVLLSVTLPLGERRGCPELRRWTRQQRKAQMVASWFGRDIHRCRDPVTDAGS